MSAITETEQDNPGETERLEPKLQVLVVDDQRPTRHGLCALLNLIPAVEVVGEASDGQESVDLVAQLRPDVVLMDLQMPVMNGIDATRRIKSRWPSVRVIALTMHGGLREQALRAGADAFLLKGSPTAALRETLIACIPTQPGIGRTASGYPMAAREDE